MERKKAQCKGRSYISQSKLGAQKAQRVFEEFERKETAGERRPAHEESPGRRKIQNAQRKTSQKPVKSQKDQRNHQIASSP